MARTKWVDHRGKKIFFVDFAKTDAAGVKEAIEEAKPVISRQAERSLLCLVDATATKFSLEISDLIKEFTMHNKPYMNVTAIIGIAGITKVVLNTAIAFTKRDNLIVKNSLEEALDFLAAKG
jgi:hypothetical protein